MWKSRNFKWSVSVLASVTHTHTHRKTNGEQTRKTWQTHAKLPAKRAILNSAFKKSLRWKYLVRWYQLYLPAQIPTFNFRICPKNSFHQPAMCFLELSSFMCASKKILQFLAFQLCACSHFARATDQKRIGPRNCVEWINSNIKYFHFMSLTIVILINYIVNYFISVVNRKWLKKKPMNERTSVQVDKLNKNFQDKYEKKKN